MAWRAGVAGLAVAARRIAARCAAEAAPTPLVPYEIVGDAIPASLTGAPGDPARGRAIVGDRRVGLCLLCHTGPFPEPRLHGTLAPDLRGAGSRLSAGQLRLRLVDGTRLNPETIMPPYYRIEASRAWRPPMPASRSSTPRRSRTSLPFSRH